MVVRTESALGLASIPLGMIYEGMSVCEHLKFALILCIIKWHEKNIFPTKHYHALLRAGCASPLQRQEPPQSQGCAKRNSPFYFGSANSSPYKKNRL